MRVVSLCPSTTETLIALGIVPVGITRFCIHPAEVVSALPKVGGTKDPRLDRIRALGPDLVLMNREENRREDAEALARDLLVDVSEPKTVEDVVRHLRALGERLERAREAAELADAIERELAATRAAARPFRFAYLVWREPWMAAGPDTYIARLLAEAGGECVLAAPRYPTVELAALRDLAPDVVLLPDEPYPFTAAHQAEVEDASGAPTHLVSGDDHSWHGVRTLGGLRAVRALAARLGGPGALPRRERAP